jgi:hypothetical protein
MKSVHRTDIDPHDESIEEVLRPGSFIAYRDCSAFVDGLEQLAGKISTETKVDPARVSQLWETFLAGCLEKAEEIDDSSGMFGQFVESLYCNWLQARQAAGTDTVETVSQLLNWMDDDPYGFCHHLENELVNVFDQDGLAEFARQSRRCFEAVAITKTTGRSPGADRHNYRLRRLGKILRVVFLKQADLPAYLDLTKRTSLTALDCHAIATMLRSECDLQQALNWVERGIALESDDECSSFDLEQLQRELLTGLGRGHEALDLAWRAFCQYPGSHTYDDLIELVPETERPAWHEKAISAAKDADLRSHLELLLKTGEFERLADLVRRTDDVALEELSHYSTQPVGEQLEETHPDLAARLWCAQGLRILTAAKNKYYDAAVTNFEHAKPCFEKAGLSAAWAAIVNRVRTVHRRKIGFMTRFEEVVAGRGPSTRPSFLARARAKWAHPRKKEHL